jgi:hypothetical protein
MAMGLFRKLKKPPDADYRIDWNLVVYHLGNGLRANVLSERIAR